MSNEPTPGPWRYSKVPYGQDLCYHIQTVDMSHRNTFIGEVGGGLQFNSEIEANARLIASAPDLLKENQELKEKQELTLHNLNMIANERDKVESINAELLQALELVLEAIDFDKDSFVFDKIQSAINKAKAQ